MMRWLSRLRSWWRRANCDHDWIIVEYVQAPKLVGPVSNVLTDANGPLKFWPRCEDGEPVGGTRFGIAGGNVISGEGPVSLFDFVAGFVKARVRCHAAFQAADGSVCCGMVCRKCHDTAVGSGKP